MFQVAGRNCALSPFRRLVTDLMHFSMKVPSATIERRMNLAAVRVARRDASPKLTWSAIFIKAYALVAGRHPDLRRSYMSFPWPRLYEHDHNIATINVEREVGGEKVVVQAHVSRPEHCSLVDINTLIHNFKEKPVVEFAAFQRGMYLSRVPWPLRHWLWWGALNVFGWLRSDNFGTFGTTTVASHGAAMKQLIPLLTSTLYYGLFDPNGCLDVRLAFDHRVLDGATAARILCDLEKVLNHEILEELRSLQVPTRASSYIKAGLPEHLPLTTTPFAS